MGAKGHQDVYYKKNEHVCDTEEIGGVIFDPTSTADNSEKFITEVRTSRAENETKSYKLIPTSKNITSIEIDGNPFLQTL